MNNFTDCLHYRVATLQTAKEIFFENPYDLLFNDTTVATHESTHAGFKPSTFQLQDL